MPPKITKEKEDLSDSNMNEYYPSLHSKTLSDISVGEILLKYQDNSQLLNHILVAKAEEDKRRTAEELRQVEEARLQTKFIEYELTHGQENNSYGNLIFFKKVICCNAQNTNHSSTSIFGSSFMDHQDQFTDHVDNASSLQAGIDNSPVPLISAEFHYGIHPECASIASSSPSVDLISPSNFDLYGENLVLSSSPPTADELVLFPPAAAEPKKINKGKKKPNASSSKNIHRTLSYESVMTLSDLNIRPKSVSPPPPPQPPLDHDKVMEALRAKLRRSSSPYQNSRPKPSPEPVPPPNTYPTTGVLLLNLKNRRRKSSVTKRGNSSK